MRTTTLLHFLYVLFSASITLALPMQLSAKEGGNSVTASNCGNRTFYVDSQLGNDVNNGLSQGRPWKSFTKINATTFCPGDKILFRSGRTWSGTLTPRGSGQAGKPITIGKYGSGNAPVLNGDMSVDCSVSSSVVYCTIKLYNQQHWVIQDVEITNYKSSEEGGKSATAWRQQNVTKYQNVRTPAQYTGNNSKKCAILVEAKGAGKLSTIQFKNLEIHSVNGDIHDKDNGGIFFEVFNSNNVASYFDNILVDNCYIHDVDRTAISNQSYFDDRLLNSSTNWTPNRNFVIRNSKFERIGANAVIMRVSKQPIIENCVFKYNGIKESGNAAFFFNTDDGIMQYNEFMYTKANIGDNDAGGPDSDFRTKRSIIQYNYIHDNDYGMLVTGGSDPNSGRFNHGTIVRYNIFENDGLIARPSDGAHVLKTSGNVTNCVFHNNVVYVGSQQRNLKVIWNKTWGGAKANGTRYHNNIIYNKGVNTIYDLGRSTNNLIKDNLYYGNTVGGDASQEANKISGDPKFTSPGNGKNGYKIKIGSAAISRGRKITGATKDYYNNTINYNQTLNVGIDQSKPVAAPTNNNSGKDVYLVIGQSNTAGRGNIEAQDQAILNNVFLFNGNNWEKAKNPMNRYSTIRKDLSYQKLGYAYNFGKTLESKTGKSIALVVNARGGTSITSWQKNSSAGYYNAAVTQVKKALQKGGTLKGIIWHQGESNRNTSSYMTYLQRMVNDLRADLGANLPVIVGQLSQQRSDNATFNNRITTVGNTISNSHWVSSNGLTTTDGTHFDSASQRKLGERYADKVISILYQNITPPAATPSTPSAPTSTLVNLAKGKSARQSTTAFSGVASRAVDGNTQGNYHKGSVTHTHHTNNPWWEVDLGKDYGIEQIKLFNRVGCCTDRLDNFSINIYNSNRQLVGRVANQRTFTGSKMFNKKATGRYVRVQIAGKGTLSLAEVQVFGRSNTITNLALGKSAKQSSTNHGGAASRAVDGKTEGRYHYRSVTHTAPDSKKFPWWEVDLGAEYDLTQINLFNRTDCCSDRLQKFRVYVFDSSREQTFYKYNHGTFKTNKEFAVAGVKGRYVRIELKSYVNPLSLAEVQVMGYGVNVQSSSSSTRLANDPLTDLEGAIGETVQDESTVSLYPIPAGDKLYILDDVYTDEITNITILDMNGVEVSKTTGSISEYIDTSSLKSGIYFLLIEKNSGVVITKSFSKL